MKKLGIYVQVPFCQTKCTYCNFHTGVVAAARFAPYAEAVCREIWGHRGLLEAAGVQWPSGAKAHLSHLSAGTTKVVPSPTDVAPSLPLIVDTVYFGGGTPSLLEPGHLQNILDAIRETFIERAALKDGPYKALEEVTLEADPETVDAGKAAAWVGAGINRVSFGLQSFADRELVASGRMHRRADIYRLSRRPPRRRGPG